VTALFGGVDAGFFAATGAAVLSSLIVVVHEASRYRHRA
jgi:hypothetical protein